MGTYQVEPSADWDNDGWSVVGGGFTKAWQAVSDNLDTTYISSPASKRSAAVSFPQDITSVPDGAKITSVSFFVRCAKTSSSFRSLTVNVISNQNCARYTSRTIYPSQTPTTYEVATYKRDPLGRNWDIHTLNHMLMRVFSYSAVSDGVRVYEMYAVVNYRVRALVTITDPSGTVFTSSPTILWNFTHDDGDPQREAGIRIFTDFQVQQVTFDPATTPPVYEAIIEGEMFFHQVTASLNPDTYWIYMQAITVFDALSPWASKQFDLEGPAPGVPGDDNQGVAGTPGIGVPTVVPDAYTSSAALTFRDTSNLMAAQQADFENGVDFIGYAGSNCTVARDTSTSYSALGSACMSLTASSAATMTATSEFFEVGSAIPVTVRAQLKAAATGRFVNAYVLFYDAAFASLGATITGAGSDVTGTWTEVVGTGTTPANTAYAQVRIEIIGPANAEVHYADHVGLMHGTNTLWSSGGHASRNLLSTFLATGDDPASATDAWIAGNAASTTTRVTTSGTGANGLKANQMTYTGVSPSLGFRAASSVFSSPTSGTNYTLNKPAGVVDGDLLLAFVTSTGLGTITAPAGWQTVNTSQVNDDTGAHVTLWVLKRTGLAADPSTWTDGSLSTSSSRRTAVVLAYTGAAAAEDQFIAENVSGSASGNTILASPAVTNTDSNAWRISAFAFSDNVSGSTAVANATAPTVPEISFVGKATVWTRRTANNQWTVNRPSGIATGDLMIATVATVDNGSHNLTFSAPTGWTTVRHIRKSGDNPTVMAVFRRTVGATEPASWTANMSVSGYPVVAQCQAYRNADTTGNPFIAENGASSSGTGANVATATVTNTDSRAWRVCSFAAAFGTGDARTWTSTETAERSDDQASEGYTTPPPYSVAVACYDSAGDVATGDHSRQATASDSFQSGVAWIGLIKPSATIPPPGANETVRVNNTVTGSSNPWLTTSVYDSGAPIATGPTTVWGIITPGSGTAVDSFASWVGLIKPATAVVAGTVASHPNATVDITNVNADVIRLAGGKVAMTASFLGSTPGTPYLIVDFYRANENLGTVIAQGSSFNTATWTKSAAVFDMPAGTTRIRPTVQADGRAVSDTVMFDRISIALGDSTVWRNGTSQTAHPIWLTPKIQYADDDGTGYGAFTDLPGQVLMPPRYGSLDGQLLYTDHTLVPLRNRKYRVQTVSYGLAGDIFASGYGPETSEISVVAGNWWIKDIANPDTNMLILPLAQPTAVGTTNTASAFQPLGEKYPIVLTEGYKADALDLELKMNRTEYVQIKKLLDSGRTLFLTSDIDHAWWVRASGDLDSEIQVTGKRKSNPLRFVKVTFIEVAPEA